MMMHSLLIANRGEIAARIIRTARRLGIRTIAVYSEADADMPFVRQADQAVAIGPAPARESYLVADKILQAARETDADAIHPGYGFLSENAAFAAQVQESGLIWVGAPPAAIAAMGLKDAAKRLMQEAGVPVTPGTLGEDQSPARLRAEADAIGYPVLIKAVAGGGGKGMRRVDDANSFADALGSCLREARSAFGDDRVLIEKYVTAPRHIEVQVFGDLHGNVVHLFERDCSLQRRHQKVIEESPAPGMDAATRAAICDAALLAARAVSYVGAGTIEFIADASEGLRADRTWFMEMNTRLQVEHPVTEAVTGYDLVEWQLRVASGEALPATQEQITMTGCAMEARLYAENPQTGFLPQVGRLDHLRLPNFVRVDSGVEQGCTISPYYDPMIAKLITHAPTREAAAARLAEACAAVEVWPVRTNAAFLARTLADPAFRSSQIDTGFIERHADRLVASAEPSGAVMQAAAQALLPSPGTDPWTTLAGFRINAPPDRSVLVEIDATPYLVEVAPGAAAGSIIWSGSERVLFQGGMGWRVGEPQARHLVADATDVDGTVLSPMPGHVIAVEVAEGNSVTRGQTLLVVEAMKMENRLVAPFDGTVTALHAVVGRQVSEDMVLARIKRGQP
ncbi:acetyl/propionyl/methylcrotonyl-CoA carboxylase subunit alpha [Lichenicoccus sp.]|uniref:acetyl/propionyl/methylcrotonyl-CoA carboxylase subunit alpha n=1 Tax=Lichenicoccus sp. TaxID=2781899 RepID=UPI003D0D74BD